MATRELSLFADLDQGRLVQGFLSTLQATLPRFVFGDSIPVSFRPLKSNGNNSVNPWSEVDLTGKTVRIAIGNPAGAASSGTFTLSYGGNTTAAIAYNADGAAIQTALNALASITAAGGVVVTRATTGAFRIVFNTAGARTAITADAAAIYPSAGVEIHVAAEGDGSTREIAVARIETLPAAYAELTDDFPVAASDIVEVRAGITEVVATKAECVLNQGGGNIDGDSFEIGAVTMIFKDSPTTENHIQTDASLVTELANIKAAINAHSTILVTAEDRSTGTLYVRAKAAGTAGNSISVNVLSASLMFLDDAEDTASALYGGLNYAAPLAAILSFGFSVLPYSGFYALEIGGEQTLGIPWDADASTLQAALELLSTVGAGKVIVSGDWPSFTLNFDISLGDIGAMTIDMTGLVVPKGRVGTLSTNTAAMIELLNGASQATVKLEVELFDISDSTTWTVLQADCTVIDDVIPNAPFQETGGPTYITTESLAASIVSDEAPYNGARQMEATECVGTVTASLNVIVTIAGGPSATVLNVGVTAGDTASVWLAKIVAQGASSDAYNFSSDGNYLTTEVKSPGAWPTMNVAITDPNGSGITPSPTSETWTDGVDSDSTPPFFRIAGGYFYARQGPEWRRVALSSY